MSAAEPHHDRRTKGTAASCPEPEMHRTPSREVVIRTGQAFFNSETGESNHPNDRGVMDILSASYSRRVKLFHLQTALLKYVCKNGSTSLLPVQVGNRMIIALPTLPVT